VDPFCLSLSLALASVTFTSTSLKNGWLHILQSESKLSDMPEIFRVLEDRPPSQQGADQKKKAMSEEPPRKKRRQTMNQTFDANRSKDSVKHAKRVQSASDPTQMPQAHNSSQFSLIFSEKVLSTTGTCECPL